MHPLVHLGSVRRDGLRQQCEAQWTAVQFQLGLGLGQPGARPGRMPAACVMTSGRQPTCSGAGRRRSQVIAAAGLRRQRRHERRPHLLQPSHHVQQPPPRLLPAGRARPGHALRPDGRTGCVRSWPAMRPAESRNGNMEALHSWSRATRRNSSFKPIRNCRTQHDLLVSH